MKLSALNQHPRLAIALQLALLMLVFQGVVATTPSVAGGHGPGLSAIAAGGSPAPPRL